VLTSQLRNATGLAEREYVNDTGYEACYLKTLSVAKGKASVVDGWVDECEASREYTGRRNPKYWEINLSYCQKSYMNLPWIDPGPQWCVSTA